MAEMDELRSAPLRETAAEALPAPAADDERQARQFEMLIGLLLALWAAVLAACDLGGSNADNGTLLLANEAASAYSWYQSKSIKQSLAENELALLETLSESGSIAPAAAAGIQDRLTASAGDVDRLKKEKTEILKGSAAVGEANWAQDVDGKLGVVTGAQEYEAKSEALAGVGDTFDNGSLLLQLCLAVGALCLLFNQPAPRSLFFWAMNALGAGGLYFCTIGYLQAIKAGMFS
jgi:hypothetical protein